MPAAPPPAVVPPEKVASEVSKLPLPSLPPIPFSLTVHPRSIAWPPSMKLETVPPIEFWLLTATSSPPKYALRATSAVNRPWRSSRSVFPS